MMKEKNKTLLKNIGLFTVGSFGSKILSFLLVPLYTYVLSTKEYGTADLLVTTVSLLIPVLTLSISDAVLRFSMDNAYVQSDIISSAMNVLLKSSIILAIILLIADIIPFFETNRIYLVFIFVYYFMNVSNSVLNLYLKGKAQVSIITISGILSTVMTCGLNILLLVVFNWGIYGYLLANTLGILVAVIYQFFGGKIYCDIHNKVSLGVTKKMILYSIPLIPNSLAWWINSASDRYFLLFFRDVSENGIYSLAYKIPTILSTVQSIFYNAWSISAIREFDKNDSDGFFGKNYSLYSFCSLCICSILMFLNIPIAKILYSENFFEAWKCVPFLLVGTMFNGLSLFEGCIYAAVRKTKIVSLTTMLGAISNIIFNIIFINFWGSIGAAFATMIGYFLTWALRTCFMRNIILVKVNWKFEIISYVFLFLQAYLGTYTYCYFWQLVIMLIILLLHKRYFHFYW